jgi:hypothetical protein
VIAVTDGPSVLSTNAAARLLGMSGDSVRRIPAERLPYWTTPGGHRRYLRRDLERYARDYLGRELSE